MLKSTLLLAAVLIAGGANAQANPFQREIDEWVRQGAASIVTRGNAEVKVKHWLLEWIDDAVHEAGIGTDQLGGVLFRYVVAKDTRLDILTSVLDRDAKGVVEKTSTYLASGLAELKDLDHLDDAVDLTFEFKNAEGGLQDKSFALYKAGLKKVLPLVDSMSKFADLVDTCADLWVSSELETTYRTSYLPHVKDAEGHIPDEEWSKTVSAELRGASFWSKIKGMDEVAIRERFRERYVNEKKIAKLELELQRLTEVWKKDNLLDTWKFSQNMTLPTRLEKLYNTREMLRRMLTRGGRLMKGKYESIEDRFFLDWVMTEWYRRDEQNKTDKNHQRFYAWLKSIGIPPEPKPQKKGPAAKKADEKPSHLWTLVSTFVDKAPAMGADDVQFDYAATANRHSRTCRIGNRTVSVVSTCTAPPASIAPDKEFSVEVDIQLEGSVDGEFTDYARVCREPAEARRIDADKGTPFKTEEGTSGFSVDQEAEIKQHGKIYGVLPRGRTDHEKICVCFRSKGCMTRWTYEWKPQEEPKKKGTEQDKEQQKKKAVKTIKGVGRVAQDWKVGSLTVWGAVSGGTIDPTPFSEGSGILRRGFHAQVYPGETISVDAKLLSGAQDTGRKNWNSLLVSITGSDPERNLKYSKECGAILPSLAGSYVVSERDSKVTATIMGGTEWWHPWNPGNFGVLIHVYFDVIK